MTAKISLTLPYDFSQLTPGMSFNTLDHWHLADENTILENLKINYDFDADVHAQAFQDSLKLIHRIKDSKPKGIQAFLQEYGLSSEEGIILMCLAEALLRIPDQQNVRSFIQEKLCLGAWEEHQGKSDSWLVNASSWALILTGKILEKPEYDNKISQAFHSLIKKSAEPVIEKAVFSAIKIMGQQFVLAETMQDAVKKSTQNKGSYLYSYDMLGEGAWTSPDADRYFQSYVQCIKTCGQGKNASDFRFNDGISVKLSALHPKYDPWNIERSLDELYFKILDLCLLAQSYNIGLVIDAEESERLTLSLVILYRLAHEPKLREWKGLGLAVQAYQKRALFVLQWIKDLSQKTQRRFYVRLVKGAYWDREIKFSQLQGYDSYPVFTQKKHTDFSYIVCMQFMLKNPNCFFPAIASHNPQTIMAVYHMAQKFSCLDFELQKLHGLGDILHEEVLKLIPQSRCRIYAPVGTYENLLAYLVRRLLENGANSSFIHKIYEPSISAQDLAQHPYDLLDVPVRKFLALPRDLFSDRLNSRGFLWGNFMELSKLQTKLSAFKNKNYACFPLIEGKNINSSLVYDIYNPAETGHKIGQVHYASLGDIDQAYDSLNQSFRQWSKESSSVRASILKSCAESLEAQQDEILYLLMHEAGKTLDDAVSEVREAIDFLRYYATEGEALLRTRNLQGPTGEDNSYHLHGRGIFVCISPWNFPLAIFLGQISAALMAGNCVIAKPAEQTSLLAYFVINLLIQAGLPKEVIALIPGRGEDLGPKITGDRRCAGVAFTGSTSVAKSIQRNLALQDGPIVPLIAETGGLNCMIVDSTALCEQVTRDVISSAFKSAGQRCSALRVLYIQDDVADKMIEMITGAAKELCIENPDILSCDVGPVIDSEALDQLQKHEVFLQDRASLIFKAQVPGHLQGHYFGPAIYELPHSHILKTEVFGPILHIVRFSVTQLNNILKDISESGYGLTFCLHSRLESLVRQVCQDLPIGNIYINRNQIGAVVGVQPFGGEGLSGTGPKAGGPLYLYRFVHEKTISIDITAAGGNAQLLSSVE